MDPQLLWDKYVNEAPNETPTAGLPAFVFDLRFPGQRYDEATGLFQNGFRDYHAGLGRYVQSDPLGLGAGWNTYGYGGQSPMEGIDPSGLEGFRDWGDVESAYVVGRRNTLVWPRGPVSRLIEHCVPAGRTFGEIHDARVEELTRSGVPDWKANIPTMPEAYIEAFKKEGSYTSRQFEMWIQRIFGLESWVKGEKK